MPCLCQEEREDRCPRQRSLHRVETFGMPLDAENGKRIVSDGFRTIVQSAALYDLKIFPKAMQTLMVGRVYTGVCNTGAIQFMQNGSLVGADRMIQILSRIQMQTAAGHILQNGSAKRHVDQLHAFADTEDGFVLSDAELQRLKLENIQFRVNMV